MSTYEDEIYNDYLARRDRAGSGRSLKRPASEEKRNRDAGSALPSGRFIPLTQQRQSSAILSEEKRRQLKGDGSYDMPDNIYKPSGYATRPSDLGEDPLSAVRTLKNQIRREAIMSRDNGLTVRLRARLVSHFYSVLLQPFKRRFPLYNELSGSIDVQAHLCDKAKDRLSAAEGVLITMGHDRIAAVIAGDTKKAQMIAASMEKLKDDVIRDSYADLVMDKQKMMAFGVNSDWSPVQKEESKPPTPKPRTPIKNKQALVIKCYIFMEPKRNPVTIETQTEEFTPKVEEEEEEKVRVKMPREVSPHNVKRNARLAERLAAQKAAMLAAQEQENARFDDPYQLPNYAGICQFCEQTGPDFRAEARLEEHYRMACVCMTRCRFCSKVVLVSKLDEHIIVRCPFVAGRMVPCDFCGVAVDATDNANGVKHPSCRGRPAPSEAQWCPLCSVAVKNTKEAWRTHLQDVCYNNPRRNGPEPDPELQPRVPSAKKSTRPSSTASTKAAANRRMIDADKLVVALQAVQLKKKEAAKKKLAGAEKSEAPAATEKNTETPAAAPVAS